MHDEDVKGKNKWADFYEGGNMYKYPTENLIRIIRGGYLDIPESGRLVDVGYGSPANLFMYDKSGYDVYGMEVHESILNTTREAAENVGADLTLDLIKSPKIPYEKEYFKIVISWNAVYYFGSRPKVAAALSEFYRVLDVGGCLLLSVIHPNSFLVNRLSDHLGEGRYRIEDSCTHDNRQGTEIFYDPTSSGWRSLLSDFEKVEEGYVEFDLFDPERRNARRLFFARKHHSD